VNTVAMDGTTPIETSRVDPEVSAYVGLVRLYLRDLAPEDLEDLTGGLEADIAELAAESEEPLIKRLGEPSAYAAELRSAAGLPPAVPAAEPQQTWLSHTRGLWRARWDTARSDHPWLEHLRPLWWVLRGAVVAFAIFGVLGVGSRAPLWLLGAALSFWVGLHQDRWDGWRSRLVLLANIATAVLVLPFLAMATAGPGYAESYVEVPPPHGVWVNGEEATSFYVYDGQGARVDGARVFTDLGSVLTGDPWRHYDGVGPEPTTDSVSVFPMEEGVFEGWDGAPRLGEWWVPPVAIPPAFPLELESSDPGASQAPPASPTTEVPDGSETAPTGAATDAATPEPTAATAEPAPEPTSEPTSTS